MKTYRIFVQQSQDAGPNAPFGGLRILRFSHDDEALAYARSLLAKHAACDVWADHGRLALLRADPAQKRAFQLAF